MNLPNLSYMTKVGQLRYIQAIYEMPEYRNPDTLVRDLLPMLQRWGGVVRGRLLINKLRSKPFYYYILARTKYYDKVFTDAISDKVGVIVNIGCGADTRTHRFSQALKQKGIKVLECDQSKAIWAKQQIAQRKWPNNKVEYCSIDLNANSWPDLNNWLSKNYDAKVQVMMEGVSPYIDEESFGRFLIFLVGKLPPGSRVAYDFKLLGVADEFGRSHQIKIPFRLSKSRDEIIAYHESRGYHVENLELSSDLSKRFLPDIGNLGAPLFEHDGLIQLLVPKKVLDR
jgi:methyltransferase (TIGR00027 family)